MGVTGQEGDVKVLIQHTPLPGEPHICSKDKVTASSTSGFRLDLEKLGVSKEIRAGLGGRHGSWENNSYIFNLLNLPAHG